jgi:hypothetical protein
VPSWSGRRGADSRYVGGTAAGVAELADAQDLGTGVGSGNFIGFPDWKVLLDAGSVVMLLLVLHLLGDLLEIGSRRDHFAASLFYNMISGPAQIPCIALVPQLIEVSMKLVRTRLCNVVDLRRS